MGRIIHLHPHGRRPWPPSEIRVGIDFSRWCVAFYRQGKLYRRASFDNEAEARAEAGRLVASGLHIQGPDEPPCVTYCGDADGDDCA